MVKRSSSIRPMMGEHLWGVDSDTLETVIGRQLAERKLSLAVMEGYTGGLLTAAITESSQAAPYFKGGLVALGSEARVAFGVDFGLISRHGGESAEVARAMAEAVRARLGTALGVGLTGLSETDKAGGKDMGTFHVAVADSTGSRVVTGHYMGEQTRIKRWAVSTALFELTKSLASPA